MKNFARLHKIFLCCCLFIQVASAQQVDSVEYFTNTDPGFGNGTGILTTHAANISNLSFNVNTTALNKGFNNLYVRSHSSNGHWSVTERWLFFKDIVVAANVNRLEYYVDTDPGFGNGTIVSITAGANISNVVFTLDITSLAKGFHNIFIRTKDNNGNWSITNKWLFFKDLIPAANVNRLEYFIDTDPGFGNATVVSITSGANIADVIWSVDVTALSNGFHNIYIRSKDNNGNWSVTNKWLFFKDKLPAANVSKLEYFVDTDPGFGSATNVSITAGANINDIVIPVNTTALSEGFHKIFLRGRDNNGSWTISNWFGFFKEFVRSPLNVKAGEYFFDTDPGFGHGNVIPFTDPKGSFIGDFNFAADVTPLGNNAPHYLFVRTLDSSNRWSLTNVISFMKSVVVPVTWLSFNAKLENKIVLLDWKTATELNSSHFEIERSMNGYQFEKIGKMNAAGNSSTVSSYNFTDRLPVKGTNYYRIKQVDLDGKFDYSEIKKVTFNFAPLFTLSNNPTNGTPVLVNVTSLPATLSIFDASGKKMKEVSLEVSKYSLSISEFANGTYLAVLNKDGRILAVEKFIVER